MAPLLVPVTINAIVSGEDIINGMDLRAFGTGPRTWSRARRGSRTDWLVIAAGGGLLFLSLGWAATGHGGLALVWLP
jgi:energy-coupling factor transporter transmembrane protein EcfT